MIGAAAGTLDGVSFFAPKRATHAPVMRLTPATVEQPTNDELCDLLEAVAVQRDRQAFAQLFKHFAPRLKAFGLRQGSDPTTAEELVQETLLTVWRKASTFDRSKATPSTWIFTIVRNKRIDMFRRQNRPEVELDEGFDAPSEDMLRDDSLSLKRSGEALREALTVLPEDQLVVLKKAFFEDKSHSEIAEELQLPLGTVKSRVRLALGRLRAHLPEQQP